MTFAVRLGFVLLSCAVFVQADVAHLDYNRYRGQRGQSLRLQRLESGPTPYPAAGYRPNRDFNLPREQPLFPFISQQNNRPQASSDFDNLSKPQRPELVYGSPAQEPRFPQQNRPQNFQGFNNLAKHQPHEFVEQSQFSDGNRNPQQSQNSNNDFNNLAEPQQTQQPQQRPELLYGAPNSQEREAQNGFDNIAEPQYNYNNAARLRQQVIARQQQAQRLQQLQQQAKSQAYRQSQFQSQLQQQQLFNSPQILYSAPLQEGQSKSKSSRLIAQKPARLTDNREEIELESDIQSSEAVEDIETTTKAEGKKTTNKTADTPVANNGVVSYYPASAFGFVQPLSSPYVAMTNYQTMQPISAAYTLSSNFLPQQYALATTAPAQVQAW